MRNNKHVQRIPLEVLDQAKAKNKEIAELLAPFLHRLSPADRQEIPKMGPKTLFFVEKAFGFAISKPNLVPQFLNMEEFAVDFADAHNLWTLYNESKDLKDDIADTQMVAGSEAFQAALVFYNSVKLAAAQNVAGANSVYEELKRRFPGGKKRPQNAESTNATDSN